MLIKHTRDRELAVAPLRKSPAIAQGMVVAEQSSDRLLTTGHQRIGIDLIVEA